MLLCYHGSDTFRLRQAVTDLIGSMRRQYGTSLHVVRVDCTEPDAADELERQLKYPSFFGDHKLIVATNAAGPVMLDILKRYVPASLEDIILVAVQDTGTKGADTKALAKLVKAADTSAGFMPLTAQELDSWIHDYCRARNTTLETGAARELLQRTGADTGRCAMELDKLCAYAQGTPIGPDMVRLLTPVRPERDEWELSNAIAAHDKRAMMTALWRKVQEGVPEQLLVGALAAGFRNLLLIKELTAQKKPASAVAKLTGLHPYVISKTLRGAGAADARRLTDAHIAVAVLDRNAKDGQADAIDGMFSLLLTL